jgi:hypothetical protein
MCFKISKEQLFWLSRSGDMEARFYRIASQSRMTILKKDSDMLDVRHYKHLNIIDRQYP